ncbi:hypothetical protein LQ327_21910 [Actinomycetospora endophytica]|uniref:Uncharacterized protein n=1 Tax=Actinomycetospora endophytica TaxID=2291215 RepID=A0ABS8PF29_9PSEU|nr:hypothetical protein [Actinomycetospora endophytica]MCD2196031.1 hypothetical protein [Actinomycetospora endophytica]
MLGICAYCHAVRPGRLTPVAHTDTCPTGARPATYLDRDDRLFFRHPDLVELDLATAAWWPEVR